MADGILIPCNVARSWHWFRQVTAPCNVACGSEIVTVNSPISGSTLRCDTWLWNHDIEFARWQHPAMWHVTLGSRHWIRQVAAPCNVAGGLGITCHWIRPNVHHWNYSTSGFDFGMHRSQHVILHQSAKFYPNRTTLGTRSKWLHVDFQDGRSPPSWILGVQ